MNAWDEPRLHSEQVYSLDDFDSGKRLMDFFEDVQGSYPQNMKVKLSLFAEGGVEFVESQGLDSGWGGLFWKYTDAVKTVKIYDSFRIPVGKRYFRNVAFIVSLLNSILQEEII